MDYTLVIRRACMDIADRHSGVIDYGNLIAEAWEIARKREWAWDVADNPLGFARTDLRYRLMNAAVTLRRSQGWSRSREGKWTRTEVPYGVDSIGGQQPWEETGGRGLRDSGQLPLMKSWTAMTPGVEKKYARLLWDMYPGMCVEFLSLYNEKRPHRANVRKWQQAKEARRIALTLEYATELSTARYIAEGWIKKDDSRYRVVINNRPETPNR